MGKAKSKDKSYSYEDIMELFFNDAKNGKINVNTDPKEYGYQKSLEGLAMVKEQLKKYRQEKES